MKQPSDFDVIMNAVRVATDAYVERVRVLREAMQTPVEALAAEWLAAFSRFSAELKQLRSKP